MTTKETLNEQPRKVLVIDDEPIVAMSIHRFLRHALPSTWTVEEETDPRVGLSRVVLDYKIAFVFVDVLMPGLTGDALIEELLSRRPDLRGKIIVCTGALMEDAMAHRLFNELGCIRLDKPFRLESLEQVTWKLIEGD